jgi:hypothetical protein
MARYYFIKSNGHLFKLTGKAYRTWIIDSANRLAKKKTPAKIRNYGINMGEISKIISENDFNHTDFIHFSKSFPALT